MKTRLSVLIDTAKLMSKLAAVGGKINGSA